MANPELRYASGYANRLLAGLGATLLPGAAQAEPHPALRWAQSGAMALTGHPGGPAQMCPVPLASYADGILAALRAQQPAAALSDVDGACLLGERAALAGYERAGAIAPGGSCRLLPMRDGWLALNLARPSDWQMLPAWLEAGELSDWGAVSAALRSRPVDACVDRGRLLGLALSSLRPVRTAAARWCQEVYRVGGAPSVRTGAPVVIDLSSLWAGPLCTQLLQRMGATVIKVESSVRPDGLRLAPDRFYDLLNAGKASVALDLSQPEGQRRLRQLLLRADIVVEASRPRALRQLGIHAKQILQENPAATWISITGHGRESPAQDWVAFGDDAAVAGGLSQVLRESTGSVMFCADAIADPLTGLHAALAAWISFARGGGRLLSLALAEVVAHCIAFAQPGGAQGWRSRAQLWAGQVSPEDVARPHSRAVHERARALGADTATVFSGAYGAAAGR